MKKYPFVKQIGIKDCGVACLRMIIQYYGGDCPIQKLRQLTNTTKEGTSAYHLIEGAKKIGLDAIGYEVPLQNISNQILPVIAYTVIDNMYQHYVVIYQISKKGILIGDPSTKLKKMKYDEFSAIFKNVIITFDPISSLPNYSETHFLKDKLRFLLKKQKRQYLLLFIIMFMITLMSILLTLPIKLVVDFVVYSTSDFLYIMLFILVILFLRFGLEQIKNHFLLKSSYSVNKQLYFSILEKILFLPYQYYRNHTTGEILTKIQDLEKVNSFFMDTFSNISIDVLMILFLSIFMWSINSFLFTIVFLITFLFSILSYYFQNRKINSLKHCINDKAKFHSYLVEAITGFETVKGLNIEREILENTDEKYQFFLKNKEQLEKCQLLENNIQNVIYYLGNVLILLISFYYMKTNSLSLSNSILFYSIYGLFLQPISNVITWIYEWKEVKTAIENVEDLLVEELLKPKERAKNFSIAYQNLNITVQPGEKIMLLGKSGVGKSTLLKMIKGYLDNDFIYPNITDKDIIYISQNEILFTDTIYHNLLIGNHNEKELSKVIQLCALEPVINKRKLGDQSLIEENGYNLSGGEKQRIILARALLQNPKVLLIDEGLSQMNLELERMILRNIIDYYSNMTVIFVSHRKENSDLFHQTYTLERNQ